MAEIWGAAIAVGGSLAAGYMQNQGAKKAGAAGQAGTDAAIAEQRRQFDLTRMDTEGARNIGNQARNALGAIYGYSPTPTATNRFAETTAGAAPVNGFAPIKGTAPGGSLNIGGSLVASGKLGAVGAVLDPIASIFGSKHGDENRNLKAFGAESGVQQLPDGRFALPDGTVFNKDQLQDVAGTWYGAKYAPDGDQAGWQQKFSTLTSTMKPDGAQGAPQGAVPTPGGGIDPRMSLGVDPSTQNGVAAPAAGAGGTAAGAPDYSNFFASPDFKFRQQQGDQAITRNASALGGLASGNTGAALADYSSNLAAGEFGNYFNRQAALAGMDQSATNTATQAGINSANNIGNAAIAGANSRASGIAAGTDAWGNALGTIAGVGYNYFNKPKAVGTGSYGTSSGNYGYQPSYGRAA